MVREAVQGTAQGGDFAPAIKALLDERMRDLSAALGVDLVGEHAPEIDQAAGALASALEDPQLSARAAASVTALQHPSATPPASWWHTPLGRAVARALAMAPDDAAVSLSDAARMLGVSRQRAHQLRQEGRLQPASGGVTRASVLHRLGAQAHGAVAAVASTQAPAARQDGESSSTTPLTFRSTPEGPAPSPPARPPEPRAPRADDSPPALNVSVKVQGTAKRRRRSDGVARQLGLPTEAAALGRECPACAAPPGRMCRDLHSRAKHKPPARQVHLARYWLDRRCPACKAPPGQPCKTPSGLPARKIHDARRTISPAEHHARHQLDTGAPRSPERA